MRFTVLDIQPNRLMSILHCLFLLLVPERCSASIRPLHIETSMFPYRVNPILIQCDALSFLAATLRSQMEKLAPSNDVLLRLGRMPIKEFGQCFVAICTREVHRVFATIPFNKVHCPFCSVDSRQMT